VRTSAEEQAGYEGKTHGLVRSERWGTVRHALGITLFVVFVMATIIGAGTPAPASAATLSGSATLVAKIVAIDHTNRVITLQDDQGNVQSIQVGSGVKRFDELKVGETVIFNYSASVATAIAKPGTATPSASSSPTITRFTGEKPSGIDPSAPSVTVLTQNGKTLSLLVHDKSNLTGLKVGDVVQITYTQTLTITVK
jgi:Cu/Ag efflux protein CusF